MTPANPVASEPSSQPTRLSDSAFIHTVRQGIQAFLDTPSESEDELHRMMTQAEKLKPDGGDAAYRLVAKALRGAHDEIMQRRKHRLAELLCQIATDNQIPLQPLAKASARRRSHLVPDELEARAVAFFRRRPDQLHPRSTLQAHLDVSDTQAKRLLQRLCRSKKIEPIGAGRTRVYRWKTEPKPPEIPA